MKKSRKKKLKLNLAINILVIMTIIVTTIINLTATTNTLRTSLTNSYLHNNYNYSNKIAESIQDLTNDIQHRITSMAELAGYPDFNQSKLDILYEGDKKNLNSIFATDENGVIRYLSPHSIQFKGGQTVMVGTKIDSDTIKKAIDTREPFISEPYQSTSGQIILLISSPIFNESGEFKGVMAGSIYLETDNVLNTMVNSHRYENNSYVFVVDRDGHIIFHPNTTRINEDVTDNEVVNALIQKKSGFGSVTNSEGIEFFAGYSYIDSLGWGVVAQTPTTVLNEPLIKTLLQAITQSIFILIFLLIITSMLVKNLTRPLTQLAHYSEVAIQNKEIKSPYHVLHVKSHIYEISKLYVQFKRHLTMLSKEIQLDGLTGIANRRTFDGAIQQLVEDRKAFALIMIDIDKFKLVNDTYGHLVGDDVLKFLATILSDFAEDGDLSFRYGGEEFGMLLLNKYELDAYQLAEEIRAKVAETISPSGEAITISLGVTSFQERDIHPKTIIERADKALYQSKENGRNRTTIYKD
jgi:diguanylate cyclase (GGDEF)-like protein